MMPPFFSVIIPTVGRTSLTRAVVSVLNQKTDCTFEVIVANDTGKVLNYAAWHDDPRVKIIETNRVERSLARNRGAAAAEGTYFIFLDDDDWLLPHALDSFFRDGSNQKWLLGDCQIVTRNGTVLETVQFEVEGNCAVQAMTGEWLPFQSMCIHRELFFELKGFPPLNLGEDREFAGRLALHADLKRIHVPLACVTRDGIPSTTVYTPALTERYWEVRDALLDAPHTFARLQDSACDAYWRGRLVRLYFNATVMHWKRKHLGMTISRAWRSLNALLTIDAVQNVPLFWRGVLKTHTTRTQ
jgi:glycosyltransferase involved in cell wall biosynthesis